MPQETKYGSSGTAVNVARGGTKNFTDITKVTGAANSDGAYATLSSNGESTNWVKVDIDNFSLSGTITRVQVHVRCLYVSYVSSATVYFEVSPNNGSTWCSSTHSSGVSTGWVWRGGDCTHHTWTASNIDNIEVRAYMVANATIGGNVVIDAIRVIVDDITSTIPDPPTWAATVFPQANRSTTALQFDWVAPGDDGGSPILEYHYNWEVNDSTPDFHVDTNSTNTIAIQTIGSSGSRTYFKVHAYNINGDGGWSTTESTYTEPLAPTGLSISSTGVGELTVTWNSVTLIPASPAAVYDTQRDANSGAGGEVTIESLGTNTTTVDTSRGDAATWWYWVRAQTPDVDGNGRSIGTYNTKVSGTTWSIPGTMIEPLYENSTETSIEWRWWVPSLGTGDPTASLTDYEYQWKIWDGSYSADVSAGVSPLLETKSDDLVAGTDYRIKMVAVNLVGQSAAYSPEETIYTAPVAPTGITATADAAGQLRVDWSAVYSDLATGGNVYDVQYSDDGISMDGFVATNITELTINDTGLGNGTNRWYKIQAKNSQRPGGINASWIAGTTWNSPGNADLSNATTDEFSQVTVTKAVVDPSDGGGTPSEPIDTWEVWRADTEFGGYSKLTGSETAIGTTTYIDITIAGNETKWYKSKYTNLIDTGALSTNAVSGTATEITDQSAGDLTAESVVKQEDQEVWHNPIPGDYEATGDPIIGDSRVKTIDQEVLHNPGVEDLPFRSDSRVKTIDQEVLHNPGVEDLPFRSDSRTKVLDKEIGVTLPIVIPDAQWDFNTTNQGTDQVGSYDLSIDGTVTFSNTGGVHGGGYADAEANAGNNYLFRNTTPIGENQPFTFIGYLWVETFATTPKSSLPLRISGTTNFHNVNIGINSSFQGGGISIGRRAKTGVGSGSGHSYGAPTLGTWLLYAIVHNNNTFHYWIDETVNYLSDNGDYDFSEGYAEAITIFGHNQSGYTFDGRASHFRIYTDYVPTLSDIQYFIANGEFQLQTAIPIADSTVRQVDQEVWHNPIQFEYYSTGDSITSDSWVEKIGEISRVSASAILSVVDMDTIIANSAIHRPNFDKVKHLGELPIADSRIKREGFAQITPLPTSFTRIIKTLEVLHNPGIEDLPIEAASTIFHTAWGLVLHNPGIEDAPITSDSRIVVEGTLMIPPMYSDSWILWAADNHTPGIIGHIDKLADTFVIYVYEVLHDPGVSDAPITSDTAIFYPDYGLIEPIADSTIFRADYGLIEPQSDSAVFVASEDRVDIYGQIDINSNTRIIRRARRSYPLQDKSQGSISTIRKTMPIEERKSNSLVIVRPADGVDSLPPINSDTLVIYNPKASDIITSDTLIIVITKIDPPIYADTRIKTFDQEITPILGDSAIFRTGYNTIDITADTLIHSDPMINISSDSKILKIFEISNITADTYVINLGTKISIDSFTAIYRAAYELKNVKSYAAVYIPAYDTIEIDSKTIVLVTQKIPVIYSDSSIRRDRSNIKVIFEKSRQL